jgi:signal transduction histidine kinase
MEKKPMMNKRQFDDSISPAKDDRRNANGEVLAFRDKSECKQVEEETAAIQDWLALRQFQKMEVIDQLAEGVACDFNDLLTIIKGYCQLSLLDMKEGDPLKKNLEKIQEATEKAVGLNRKLFALKEFSR